jgi:hypothetical protein
LPSARNVRAALSVIGALAFAPTTLAGGVCPADLSGDGAVGGPDLAALLSNWGGPGPSDLDGDGLTDATDLAALLAAWGDCPAEGGPLTVELAGNPLSGYPWAELVQSFNAGATVSVAVDPARVPTIANALADVYVVANRSAEGWAADTALVDVRGQPQSVTFGATFQTAVQPLETAGLGAGNGLAIGTGYDLVVDLDRDGTLGAGDLIDGIGDAPGFWMVADLTAAGPLAVSQVNSFDTNDTEISSSFQLERIYYPTDIAALPKLPLVVISHGNGHQYTWYDYLGQHLASWGYVVMAHQNNTGPGVETASTTTLAHTDAILTLQGSIAGGVLAGKIDADRIVWIGHSRGGEGVARAYDRIFDGTYVPTNYTIGDIKFVSSIAPTDFLGTSSANPHAVNYHLLYGAADGDVCGCPDSDIADSFNVFERASGERASLYVHGADHNDFNCCGFDDFSGPSGSAIGRPAAQVVAKGAYLPLLRHFVDGDPAAKEYLWRQYESLRPLGVGANVIADLDYRDPHAENWVIDDFQTGSGATSSSSGGTVALTVGNATEGLMNDANTQFTWVTSDPWNGMTRARSSDSTRGLIFDWTAPSTLEWSVVPTQQDLSGFTYLSLRAAQGTRHPQTVALAGTLTFSVTLIDALGASSSIDIGVYKGGVQRPYQRSGFGSGLGWQNEFEVIRIRLTDFLAEGSGVDLSQIATVRLSFGGDAGSLKGRLAIDDLMLDKN